jgi:hypothetical protein
VSVTPGGTWWSDVEPWKAKRAGDTETVAKLEAKAKSNRAAIVARIARLMAAPLRTARNR